MGWLWSSSPANGDRDANRIMEGADKSKWSLSEEQRERVFGKSGALQQTDQSRDTQADRELESFLNSLSPSERADLGQVARLPPNSTPSTQPQEPTSHDRILPDGTLNIAPLSLYPRTMSCRQAFDQAFYCQSLGGKFNDIYRFGHLQSCSEHWAAFWFCMRTKQLPQGEKQRQIRDHYVERDQRKRGEFGSSEAVWDVREKAVERAFWKNPDTYEGEEGGVKE